VRKRSGKAIAATFAAAVLALVAGCGGSASAPSAAAPTEGGAALQGTVSPAATGAAPTTTAAPTTSAAAGGSSPAASATGSTAARTNPVAAKAPGKPTGFTRPGTYTYDLSGTADQPFGGSQSVSGTDTDTVDAPQGSRQHSKTSGQNGSQDATLEVRNDGLHVIDIAIQNQGFSEDFRPVGDAVYFPAGYRVGKKWSWQAKSTDGKYTLDVTSTISGTTSVTVDGKSLKALVVDSTLHITGAGFDITDQQRDWVSDTYALVLKEHSVTHGTAYGATISSDITRRLRSTTPR
jgi:hypothetical protein